MKGKRIYKRVGMIVGGLFFAAGLALLFGLVAMALWNWLMPEIFGLPEIAYWQAWGLVLLAHILFKGGRSESHGHGPSRGNGEWKERFKDRMSKRFSGESAAESGDDKGDTES